MLFWNIWENLQIVIDKERKTVYNILRLAEANRIFWLMVSFG